MELINIMLLGLQESRKKVCLGSWEIILWDIRRKRVTSKREQGKGSELKRLDTDVRRIRGNLKVKLTYEIRGHKDQRELFIILVIKSPQ